MCLIIIKFCLLKVCQRAICRDSNEFTFRKWQSALFNQWSLVNSSSKEAKLFGNVDEINILTEENGKTAVTDLDFSNIAEQYDYVHYCPNETISGGNL